MSRSTEPRLGFTLWLQTRAGLSPADEATFTRRLEDHLAEQNLSASGARHCAA